MKQNYFTLILMLVIFSFSIQGNAQVKTTQAKTAIEFEAKAIQQPYSMLPLKHASVDLAGVTVKNIGDPVKAGDGLLIINTSPGVYFGNMDIPEMEAEETITIKPDVKLTATELGEHIITYVAMDAADENPFLTGVSTSFEVTENVFAADDNTYRSGYSPTCEYVGNVYTLIEKDKIQGCATSFQDDPSLLYDEDGNLKPEVGIANQFDFKIWKVGEDGKTLTHVYTSQKYYPKGKGIIIDTELYKIYPDIVNYDFEEPLELEAGTYFFGYSISFADWIPYSFQSEVPFYYKDSGVNELSSYPTNWGAAYLRVYTVSDVTGMETIDETLNVTISSTITNGPLTIETEAPTIIKVVDISGRVLNAYTSTGKLDITLDYKSGLYLIVVESEGKVSSHKIVKQ